MTSVPHSGAKSVTPGGSVAGGHTLNVSVVGTTPTLIQNRQGTTVGQAFEFAGEASWPEACANASLWSAAPDLLAVAQIVRMSFGWQTLSEETKALLDAAIAKATAGETRNAEPIHRRDGDEG